MNEAWVTIFGTNALAITAGAVSVRPGLGRHQLAIPVEVRPTNDAALGHFYRFAGRVDATGLRGGGGYLGTAHLTDAWILNPHGKIDDYLLVDLDPNQIHAIEARRDSGFTLTVRVDVFAERDGLAADRGATSIMNHPVAREEWLTILEQVGYRRTVLVELPMPTAHDAPALANAIDFFAHAQRRFLEGQNRLAVESLRQSLAAIVNKDPAEEDDGDSIAADLKSLHSDAHAGTVGYRSRYEHLRRALKFLTDLGAHPEIAETTPAEARSALLTTAGVLQWYATADR